MYFTEFTSATKISYVHVTKFPRPMNRTSSISLTYKCNDNHVISLSIYASIEHVNTLVKLHTQNWTCDNAFADSIHRVLNLELPDFISGRPDSKLSKMFFVKFVKVKARLWVINKTKPKEKGTSIYEDVVYTRLLAPSDRPVIRCQTWTGELAMLNRANWFSVKEKEVYNLIEYPTALSGSHYGVYRVIPEYKNWEVEQDRKNGIYNPRFTISLMLYIVNPCLFDLCSIMHKASNTNVYQSPLLFINNQGYLHIQVALKNGETSAQLTDFRMARNQWIRIVFSLYSNSWNMTVNYGPNFRKRIYTRFSYPEHEENQIVYNDTDGIFVFGGSEMAPSFQGYIGQVKLHRDKAIVEPKIEYPKKDDPMFTLKIGEWEDECRPYKEALLYRIKACQDLKQKLIEKKSCPSMQHLLTHSNKEKNPVCISTRKYYSAGYRNIKHVVCSMVLASKPFNEKDVGKKLYQKAVKQLEESFNNSRQILKQLKQSACLGNADSSFLASAIYNNGIGTQINESLAMAYQMWTALDNHPLTLLALGHKHNYGLDGVLHDQEQAYGYFKEVAELTKTQKYKPDLANSNTEHIRLIDEFTIKQQTDEKGDLFLWLKHQANQGVASAQENLGRLLFWGSQGVNRNLEEAVQYYRMGAEQNDPTAMFNYGISTFMGQGVDKNQSEGLKHILKSAELGDPNALNAVGWYAMNFEFNYTKAAENYEKAFELGCVDAGFNLGLLHQNGWYPNKTANKKKAYEYFSWAASHGQLESGISLADYNMRGMAYPRNIPLAVEWARYIAEKHAHIGQVLKKGLTAYEAQEMRKSLLYYLLAAESGVETGSFNTAYLSEENHNDIVRYIGKECTWRHYNLSTLRQPQFVDNYALLKMGDMYWYGYIGVLNVTKSVEYYMQAAIKHEPQAIFNLAQILEHNHTIPRKSLNRLGVEVAGDDKYRVLVALYTRCQDMSESEAYLPCSLALNKVQILHYWKQYSSAIKVCVVILCVLGAILCIVIIRDKRNTPAAPIVTLESPAAAIDQELELFENNNTSEIGVTEGGDQDTNDAT